MSYKKYRVERNCLNCGAEVFGRFCHECGQENVETRDNFFHMVWHFITDYFHFDSKFFRSLLPLIARPGFLTREYWDGKRSRYIPPIRLFFFVTIIFMVSTSWFYHKFGDKMKDGMIKRDRVLARYDSAEVAQMSDTTKITIQEWHRTVTPSQLTEMIARDNRQFRKLQAGVDFVFRNLKYVTFFLLPVYALIFKLLYLRRRSFYIDHVIYVMHVQSFVYIVLSLLFVIPAIWPAVVDLLIRLMLVILFAYVIISLRFLYHQPWWKTVLKSVLATFALFFSTVLTIVLFTATDAIFFQ